MEYDGYSGLPKCKCCSIVDTDYLLYEDKYSCPSCGVYDDSTGEY